MLWLRSQNKYRFRRNFKSFNIVSPLYYLCGKDTQWNQSPSLPPPLLMPSLFPHSTSPQLPSSSPLLILKITFILSLVVLPTKLKETLKLSPVGSRIVVWTFSHYIGRCSAMCWIIQKPERTSKKAWDNLNSRASSTHWNGKSSNSYNLQRGNILKSRRKFIFSKQV